jgi:GAF domain-containing protein
VQYGRLNERNMAPRYELEELVEKSRLSAVQETFVQVTRLAGGVVKNPPPGQKIPTECGEFPKWRLTPVTGRDRVLNPVSGGSRFCSLLRRLDYGDQRCMKADLDCAKSAYARRDCLEYPCVVVGLTDLVAPVVVGGHHLANIYSGQIRPATLSFEKVWDIYDNELCPNSTNTNEKRVSKAVLQAAFDELWRDNDVSLPIADAKSLLMRVAELISHAAAAMAICKFISELSAEVAHGLDLPQDMVAILQKSSRILRFTSGSIIVKQHENHPIRLESMACLYPEEVEEPSFDIDSPLGIAPHVFRTKEPVLCRNRSEMEALKLPADATSRDKRGIQSLLAAPILFDNESIGVIEIGDKEENVYGKDDLRVLEALAKFTAMRIQANAQLRRLHAVLQTRGLSEVLKRFKQEVPALVHGKSCAIFLRCGPDGRKDSTRVGVPDPRGKLSPDVCLVSTNENGVISWRDVTYTSGLGFTGWVLQNAQSLRIDGGLGARTRNLATSIRSPSYHPESNKIKWAAKSWGEDATFRTEFYENRPFLATPIILSGVTVGVIGIPDAVTGRDNFSSTDEAILRTCSQWLASALEVEFKSDAIDQMLHDFVPLAPKIRQWLHWIKESQLITRTYLMIFTFGSSFILPVMAVALVLGCPLKWCAFLGLLWASAVIFTGTLWFLKIAKRIPN